MDCGNCTRGFYFVKKAPGVISKIDPVPPFSLPSEMYFSPECQGYWLPFTVRKSVYHTSVFKACCWEWLVARRKDILSKLMVIFLCFPLWSTRYHHHRGSWWTVCIIFPIFFGEIVYLRSLFSPLFSCGAGDQTQGPVHTKYILYYWAIIQVLLCSVMG